MTTKVDFDDFVATRSTQLLRTAYLLTHGHPLAEDLLQTALTKSWFAWSRIEGNPEPYVRKVLVNTYATWWRRKWNGERPTDDLPDAGVGDPTAAAATSHDLWQALGRLPRRQRAVVVLRYFEDLSEAETAECEQRSAGTGSLGQQGSSRNPGARGLPPCGLTQPVRRKAHPAADER